ncbi:MAG TPA: hypothetical protein VHY34_07155 [Caulobacteraceae bacterium]|jgi:hypothetical protein|nr:hypothetical protein [Caulobacteraceae bacterium]
MARAPNYSFERSERERQKANKSARKADDKREQRERARAGGEGDKPVTPSDEQ